MSLRPLLLLVFVLVAASCQRVPHTANEEPVVSNPVSVYEARGVVRRIDLPAGKAVIAHDTIAGYMDAMTMEFTAAEAKELQELNPGDVITFRLQVGKDRSSIDRCRKTGERVEVAPLVPAPAMAASGLAVGDIIRDCEMIDQNGMACRIGDFRGQVLALTFIFTRCPLPDYCPLLSSRFAETEHLLSATTGDGKWHLVSLSFDPDYDTPERLSRYAAQFHSAPGRWTFATGRPAEILGFAAACGVAISQNGEQIDHNLRTLVVDAEGRVRRIFTGNQWAAQELADEIRRAAKPLP